MAKFPLNYEQALAAAQRGCILSSPEYSYLRWNEDSNFGTGGWQIAVSDKVIENGGWVGIDPPRLDWGYSIFHDPIHCAINHKRFYGDQPFEKRQPNYGKNGPLKPEPLPILNTQESPTYADLVQAAKSLNAHQMPPKQPYLLRWEPASLTIFDSIGQL